MYLKHINISDFRNLSGIEFNLGRYTTVISGHNATGKSTILALLGHCAQLRKYKPIIKSRFQCEWAELIKASSEFDKAARHVAELSFVDIMNDSQDPDVYEEQLVDSLYYRTTWQQNKKKDTEENCKQENAQTRFRLLPVRTETTGRRFNKKVEWPTLYLGLSRLYPVGESSEIKIETTKLADWTDELADAYRSILRIPSNTIRRFDSISICETTNKKAVGITTETYDAACNSAGQDNLGQIILAILSFEKLKEEIGPENWNGGLLLIDELDATLHPASLKRLYDYMRDKAKSIGIQIVFTTHSLYLIQQICGITDHNRPNRMNAHELVYLTSLNGRLQKLLPPTYDAIYHNITLTTRQNPQYKPITLYSEDDEARWFLSKLLPQEYMNRITCPTIKMGCESLTDLLIHDNEHFRSHIFLFDGDVSSSRLGAFHGLKSATMPNVLRLPGEVRPEQVFFDYFFQLDPNHYILNDPDLIEDGYNKESIKVEMEELEGKKAREIYKKLFNGNRPLMEKLYDAWEDDHPEIANRFRLEFVKAFDSVAEYIGIPKMHRS